FDALYALALDPDAPARRLPPWLTAMGQLVLPSLRPLAAPNATARDALRVAERLAGLFPDTGGADEGAGMLPDLVTVLLDAEPGDALPGDGDEAGPGRVAADRDDEALPAQLEEGPAPLVGRHLRRE